MVVAVTGASGQLGQSLRAVAGVSDDFVWHFASSAEVDITDANSIKRFLSESDADFCINAAAYTAVDKAESEPEKAHLINVKGARNLAEVCRDLQVKLVHISTDFVFDGTKQTPYRENDLTNPQGVYAQTKLDGEKAIAETFENYFIIRTSWVYSEFGNNFMKTMLRLASERGSVNVVDDQIGTPTQALDLARAIIFIIQSKKDAFGIYHFSNEGETSWHDFAAEIFKINHSKINLGSIATTDYLTPAKRPKYSVLDKTKIKQTFGIRIRDWQDALRNP